MMKEVKETHHFYYLFFLYENTLYGAFRDKSKIFTHWVIKISIEW